MCACAQPAPFGALPRRRTLSCCLPARPPARPASLAPHQVGREGLALGVPERVHEDLVVLDGDGAHRGVCGKEREVQVSSSGRGNTGKVDCGRSAPFPAHARTQVKGAALEHHAVLVVHAGALGEDEQRRGLCDGTTMQSGAHKVEPRSVDRGQQSEGSQRQCWIQVTYSKHTQQHGCPPTPTTLLPALCTWSFMRCATSDRSCAWVRLNQRQPRALR